ncbi:hypothetical protein N7492_001789 [Penicillium capsulatum]|uniref:Enoyl reductase (ER) domain-containing protein n=1 Tax=Penicillium capsulatum TaxID=69766 RepID=A0A9W9ITW8_9EURO|nr:hypothetical protein N7492_001789 [Penicillium capsulatum]KAJ6129161.1 hypothetical protein N7512_001941 [Penicillium capsulatum]
MDPTVLPPGTCSFQPENMKAWLYSRTSGGLEKNLSLSATARPPPAPRGKEVMLEVISAALNPADLKLPELGFPMRMYIGMPATPGMDFCGRVVATGPLAQHWKEGQMVFGCSRWPGQFGSLAEYLVASGENLALVPAGVKEDHVVTLGVAGQTAYQSLVGHVKAGDRVLINGGSGGCGVFAIQIAKQMGCRVTATCSTKNMELCLRVGADEVIDYTAEADLVGALVQRGVVFDCIVDHVGLPSTLYYQCHHFLKEDGAFVQVGAYAFTTIVLRALWPAFLGGGRRKYVVMGFKPDRKQLEQLAEWLEDGTIQPQLDSVYEFDDAVKAFERLRTGRTRGKIVVHVGSSRDASMEAFGIGM